MKKLNVICILMCLVVGLAVAENKSEDNNGSDGEQQKIKRNMPRGINRPVDRSEMYQQMLERRFKIHKAEIDELEAIKKIAEEEGATRTVEAIEALIEKKSAEYKKSAAKFELQRRQHAEQIQKRQSEGPKKEKKAEGTQADEDGEDSDD